METMQTSIKNYLTIKHKVMSSIKPIRDPKTDHLLTPENSALLIIDYQPIQVHSITSMDRRELVENISNICRVAKGFNVPVILTTVNVATGLNQPTIPQIKKALPGQPEIDRTSVNSMGGQGVPGSSQGTRQKETSGLCAMDRGLSLFSSLGSFERGL